MNKSVLISIRPEWCEKIASGQKTIEVRKTRPKINAPFKCYIYCTKGEKTLARGLEILNGCVIGEFTCSHIELIRHNLEIARPFFFTETPYTDFFAKSQLTEIKLLHYLGDNNGYGWHISDLVIYDNPKLLHNFYRYCKEDVSYTDLCLCCKKYKQGVCKNFLTRSPQSWCYVEEL